MSITISDEFISQMNAILREEQATFAEYRPAAFINVDFTEEWKEEERLSLWDRARRRVVNWLDRLADWLEP